MLFLMDDELQAGHLWELTVRLGQESHQLIQHGNDGAALHLSHHDIVVVRQHREEVAIGQIASLHLVADTTAVEDGDIRTRYQTESIGYDIASIGLCHTVDLITLVVRDTQVHLAMAHQSARLCMKHGIDAIHHLCHICIPLLHALDGDE